MMQRKPAMIALISLIIISLVSFVQPIWAVSKYYYGNHIIYIVSDDDGLVYCINRPEAVHFVGQHNRTYFTYITPDGYVKVFYFDHDTKSFSQVVTVASNPIGTDTHGAPAILIDPQGYIHIFYGSHNSKQYYVRSTNPEDITSWTSPKTIASSATYPIARYYNGTIYVFFRGPNVYQHSFVYSTDGGETWNGPVTFIDSSGPAIYRANVIVDSQGRFHVVWTIFDYSDNTRKHVYYAWSPNLQTWYSAGGTNLGNVIDQTEADTYCKVYDSSNDPRWNYLDSYYVQAHAIDVVVNPSGNPIVLYKRFIDASGAGKFVYRLAVWNGTAWEHYDIAESTAGVNWEPEGAIEVSGNIVHVYVIVNGQLFDAYTVNYVDWSLEPLTGAIGVDGVQLVENYTVEAKLFISFDKYIAVVDGPVPSSSGGSYYREVIITNQVDQELTNYSVKLELNSTNFGSWDKVQLDGSDIYFTDSHGNPLYYWIEYFDTIEQKATIWVKVPSIPASSSVTIYMYYGGDNLYVSYNNPEQVFLFYDDFNDLSKWTVEEGSPSVSGGVLNLPAESAISTTSTFEMANTIVEGLVKLDDNYRLRLGFKERHILYDIPDSVHGEWQLQDANETVFANFNGQDPTPNTWQLWRIAYFTDRIVIYLDDTYIGEFSDSHRTSSSLYLKHWVGGTSQVDWIRVRKYVEPEPSVNIGSEELPSVIRLPPETLYLVHEIAYSPNSTQFSHSFTATNTTTAGYEANYTSPYGWRVYANPYQSGGTGYENTATLISEVNITLPYSEVLVENVTLLARTNGTGSFRQLWVKVLDSAGGVVAELTNATIGTGWTEVALPINANLSNQITIWINATVKSTTTAGEEMAVRDVRVHVEHKTNPQVTVSQVSPNAEFFNCSASHYVELGSAEYLNLSIITFKLIQYLTYNATDYPVQPSYVGDETIGSYSYSVYRIDPANYSQSMTIYALLENRFKAFRTHVKGYDTETVLVGEPLTIELPELGNITISELNRTFINVSSVTVSFSSTGSYTIVANLTQPTLWKLGYGRKTVIVKYGAFSAKPIDIDSKVVDYEDLVLQLINKTDGNVVREVVGNQLFSLDSLWAGNYSIVVRFKDIVIGAKDFELNITTDASTIDIPCTMRILAKDYRGLNRSIAYEYGKQLVDVVSLSTKYPYSRMRILLNGTGSFRLYVNYRGDLPTRVKVVGNVTNLQYHWDGNYLVITGTLGSVGEINVTDLYKLRVEMYDRLGNLMPSWVYAYVNGTKYSGSVVEDYYYPEDYVIELPKTINGFEFYGFYDGYNETARAITINSSDVTLKAWYRVPTSVEVKSYQVASLWWLPFVRQEGETVRVYVEGCLRDFYGNGVPNRPLVMNITNVETSYTRSYNVTTDASGYFRTPLIELFRGKTYRVKVIYNGDDVYVGTLNTLEVKPEELPAAPTVFEVPIDYILVVVGVALIIVGIAVAVRASKHVIEDVRKKTRRFVREK